MVTGGQVTAATGAGAIGIPGLEDREGQPVFIAFDYNYSQANQRHSFQTNTSGAGQIGDFSFEITNLAVVVQNGQVHSAAGTGSLGIPGFEDAGGQPARLAFSYAYDIVGNQHSFGLASTGTFFLGDLEFGVEALNLRVGGGQVQSASGSFTFVIPNLTNASGPARLSYSYVAAGDQHQFSLTGGISGEIGPVGVELTALSIAVAQGNLQDFTGAGSVELPGLTDGDGDPLTIAVAYTYDSAHDYHRFSAGSNASLQLGSVSVSITQLVLAFDRNGFREEDTLIAGEIRVPAFVNQQGAMVPIAICIQILADGFLIVAQVPEGGSLTVLDIEDVVLLEMERLELGKDGPNWRFGIAGELTNRIELPVVSQYLPRTLDVNDFTFDDGASPTFDFSLAWPDGLSIGANHTEGLNAFIPIDMDLGGVAALDGIQLSGNIQGNALHIDMAFVGAALKLGPVVGVVDGLGFTLNIERVDGGNLGMLDLGMEIKPPTGIGLSLDAGGFRGGGYLMFDPDNARYAGALELTFAGSFSLTAIGLLTTRLPDGGEGISLLVIISTQFPSPIPLGFNFWFTGIGGMIGLHRSVNTDALRAGVKSGTLDHILFPENVIANISRIISDLREIFPPVRDQFIIGVMAKITWNVPPILSVELGLMVEFADPVRIAILGVMKAALPTAEAALVQLQVNFLGIIDFEKQMLSFDASLFNSRILFITLEGDMALRLSWGRKRTFCCRWEASTPTTGRRPIWACPA
ncbi:MAG: hypothetical protein D6722_05915 [Bacteroidetes bacterium]|nr:MAG: hypothetical protein D6722_05915 [Bacteroidota bacterium]